MLTWQRSRYILVNADPRQARSSTAAAGLSRAVSLCSAVGGLSVDRTAGQYRSARVHLTTLIIE